ncbi:MAG: hypothetical protein KKD38_04270 [Candidatus Delongbacteria bacterium]|nr:hypothetical protein [Candidatus Delongbacteria bacterium]MCG2760499.1 hypothetical protein [Candidatus Delongbacteria bacterium]
MFSYVITIQLKSALATPLHADTIFGHICWAIKFSEGNAALEEFLSQYDNGNPPVILSSAFPHGFLPKPIFKPQLSSSDITFEQIETYKQIKKIQYIPNKYFFDSIPVSESELVKDFKKIEFLRENSYLKTVAGLHNTINRISGTMDEDQALYSSTESWYKENSLFDIFVLTDYDKEKAKNLFVKAFESGFGANKSIGKGIIVVKEISETVFPKKGNRAMALSNFVINNKNDVSNFRYDLFTKFGKLGGDYAITKYPFKKPVIMYKSGSSFDSISEKFTGCLLKNIHSDEKIRHYAYTPVINFNEVDE